MLSSNILLRVGFQFTHPGRGATVMSKGGNPKTRFQFTHPGRGATRISAKTILDVLVSIHAPREGCDLFLGWVQRPSRGFNSRTPGGVRL